MAKGNCGKKPAASASRDKRVAFFQCYYNANLPGAYEGNNKSYKGLAWGDFYYRIATHDHPKVDPQVLANQVLGIYAAQKITGNIGQVTNGLANFVTQSGKAGAGAFGGGGTCVVKMPLGAGCLIDKTQARAVIGGLALVGGFLILGTAVIVLAAGVLTESPVGQAASKITRTVPATAAINARAQARANQRLADKERRRQRLLDSASKHRLPPEERYVEPL